MAATAAPKELNPDASILGPRAARLARGPDFSQLRPPIKTTVSGTRQVIHALETATGEVKKVLLDEINLMYECKICQSVFRSLANLISHKRTFCKTKYNQALHLYQDKEGTEAANMQTVLIEAEPVECVAEAQTSHDLSCYSPSLELLKTAGILEDLMARRRPCVGPGGHGSRLVAPGRQRLGAVVEGLKEKMDGAQHTMLGLKKNFEAPRPQSTMHLEPMFETRSAFQQSWLYSDGSETVGQTYRAWQQAEAENRRIKVGPAGEVMTNDATVKLVTGPDGHTYSVRVPVGDDVKGGTTFGATEEAGNVKYPCPHCKRTFLQVKKVIGHMVKVHDETIADAKKLRGSIKSSGAVAEPKGRTVRVNDTNCRPVKPMQVKVQNLTLTLNGKMNLCEQLSTDQSAVCPIMKTRISESTKVTEQDTAAAEAVNRFVAARESEEEAAVPSDVEEKIAEQVNRRRVQCKLCQKTFSRSLLVRNHVASVHLGLKRWACSLCEHGTWSRQACLGHVATQHRLADVASAVREQPKSVYFREFLPEPSPEEVLAAAEEVLAASAAEALAEAEAVPNGDGGPGEAAEEELPELESDQCIMGMIINENNGSNGLPTPEEGPGSEPDGEEGSEPGPGGRSPRGRGGPARGRGGGARGRQRGRPSRGSARSSNSSRSTKRSREPSDDDGEDTEVTLNLGPAGKVARGELETSEDMETSEDTLPEDEGQEGGPEETKPPVPKLLIKFAGPNNTSPTINKVPPRRGVPSPPAAPRPPPDLVPLVGPEDQGSVPASPSPPGSRDSSASRSRSRSGDRRTSSDLDSPRKPEARARR